MPKGVVLLADVIPSFLAKLCGPYFVHVVPYSVRVLLFGLLSTSGMILIALTPEHKDGGTVTAKMVGVMLASLSSGFGELSFLGLTHFYGPFSLAAWGSGTGGAGLIGAGAYAIATTALKMTVKNALLSSSLLPIIMMVSFFVALPRGNLQASTYTPLKNENPQDPGGYSPDAEDGEEGYLAPEREEEGLLVPQQSPSFSITEQRTWFQLFKINLKRARKLFFPL